MKKTIFFLLLLILVSPCNAFAKKLKETWPFKYVTLSADGGMDTTSIDSRALITNTSFLSISPESFRHYQISGTFDLFGKQWEFLRLDSTEDFDFSNLINRDEVIKEVNKSETNKTYLSAYMKPSEGNSGIYMSYSYDLTQTKLVSTKTIPLVTRKNEYILDPQKNYLFGVFQDTYSLGWALKNERDDQLIVGIRHANSYMPFYTAEFGLIEEINLKRYSAYIKSTSKNKKYTIDIDTELGFADIYRPNGDKLQFFDNEYSIVDALAGSVDYENQAYSGSKISLSYYPFNNVNMYWGASYNVNSLLSGPAGTNGLIFSIKYGTFMQLLFESNPNNKYWLPLGLIAFDFFHWSYLNSKGEQPFYAEQNISFYIGMSF